MKVFCTIICFYSILVSSASALEKIGSDGMAEIDARSGVTMTFADLTTTTVINKLGYEDGIGWNPMMLN